MKDRFFLSLSLGLVVAFSLLFTEKGHCLTVPEKPGAYVNDYAGLLGDQTRQKLEILLGEFERSSGNQIVVAIFNSLEGDSLEDFSIRLAQQWKIGSKKNNNGVILLVFKKDRKVRMEVGYGLEGALPDALSGQIIRRDIGPAFRSGQFGQGIEDAVKSIMRATAKEYKAPEGAAAPSGGSRSQDDPFQRYAPIAFIAMIFFFFVPILCYVVAFFLSGSIIGGLVGYVVGAFLVLLLIMIRKVILGSLIGQTLSAGSKSNTSYWGGGFGGGGGGSFGGGFGGGGGGSFGGGGASGSW